MCIKLFSFILSIEYRQKDCKGINSTYRIRHHIRKCRIVVWEDYQVLWVVRASAHEHTSITDEYTFIYARSQEHVAVLLTLA